jgi:hypothetical protein
MNATADGISLVLFVVTAMGALVAGLAAGFFLGKRNKAAAASGPLPLSKEDTDAPTAPITPMIEMGRSPHDRHRDLSVGNALVTNIEMLEFILKSGGRQEKEDLISQIGLLKTDFQALLGICSFRAFDYAPGTTVEAAMRSRIQIVEGKAGEERTKIVRTLRCGFVYEPGAGDDPVVIRKAEVEIG